MTSRTQGRESFVRCALVFAREHECGAALYGFLKARASRAHWARSLKQAEQLLRLEPVDAALVVSDVSDDEPSTIIDMLCRQPKMPQVVVIGNEPSALVAFEWAQAGVRALLPGPFEHEELSRVWDQLLNEAPDVRPFLRASVGRVGLTEMIALVRSVMLHEALAATGGSRRSASGLLGISRQLLQYALRTEPPPATS